ncbi:MAG: ATP-dependent metallopeptidase FtsH/Yme1/Tma family protein, partial [Bryobacteraceae bacterium]
MSSNVKMLVFWAVLIGLAIVLFTVMRPGQEKERQVSVTEFVSRIKEGKVKEVSIAGTEVKGTFTDGPFRTEIPANFPDIYRMLTDAGIKFDYKESGSSNWVSLLINISPFILLGAWLVIMMRQMQSGGNKALSFGKSRARLHSTQQKKVTFKDVAGVEEA